MTRINVVEPSELSREHLIAEYRELPRIFNNVRHAIYKGKTPVDYNEPNEYVLGTGHMKFFYTRLGFLKKRQESLIVEMHKRGYHTTFSQVDINDIPDVWKNDWIPDEKAVELNRKRIKDRTENSSSGSQSRVLS